MLYLASFEVRISLGNAPNFLQTDAVVLFRNAVFTKVEVLLDSLCKGTSASFSENSLLRLNLNTGLVCRFQAAILSYAKVSSYNTADTAILVVLYLVTCNAWENVNSHGFCLLSEPLAEVAQTDDIVAVVVYRFRQEKVGDVDMLLLKQNGKLIMCHWGVQWGTLLLPVGTQLIQSLRLETISRQDVSTDLCSLFY